MIGFCCVVVISCCIVFIDCVLINFGLVVGVVFCLYNFCNNMLNVVYSMNDFEVSI